MSGFAKPLPHMTPPTQPFWDGTRAGRLLVQRCGHCGTFRFPPARICHVCLSEEVAWVRVSGRGTVWSMCEFHRSYFKGFEADLPYNVVLVRLDEGPRLYSNLVDLPYERITIGMRVQAMFEPVTEEVTLLKFEATPE